MATYYHGNSEIQSAGGGADGLQTLVLMNPGSYIQYSDNTPQQPPQSHTAGNLVFLNAASAASNNNNNSFSPHAPPTHGQQFVGIPLQASSSQDLNHHHQQHHHSIDVPSLHGFMPRMQYNLWNTIDGNPAARDTPRAQQGLSLSLSPQQVQMGSFREGQAQALSGGSPSSASGVTHNGASGVQSVLLSSKYLRAAHELLEEVANVNTELAKKSGGQNNRLIGESSVAGSGGGEGSEKRSAELSTAERQEIQMKKAKLISMLDEVLVVRFNYSFWHFFVISSFGACFYFNH